MHLFAIFCTFKTADWQNGMAKTADIIFLVFVRLISTTGIKIYRDHDDAVFRNFLQFTDFEVTYCKNGMAKTAYIIFLVFVRLISTTGIKINRDHDHAFIRNFLHIQNHLLAKWNGENRRNYFFGVCETEIYHWYQKLS